MNSTQIWLFLIPAYVATVIVELPVLYFGLDRRHSRSQRITFGFLLTAFTYPVVALVLPAVITMLQIESRMAYLAAAETFAPVAEVLFFRFVLDQRMLARPDRDAITIVVANLASFLAGEVFLSGWLAELIRRVSD